MYALCVSGAVNTYGFVWKFFMRYIKKFIHSNFEEKGELKHGIKKPCLLIVIPCLSSQPCQMLEIERQCL